MRRAKDARDVVLALLASSCSQVVCGPGTVQMQAPDGALRCVPTEATAPQLPCNVDARATIVAGYCVSAISCDANTTLDPRTDQRVATGIVSKPACQPPAAGNTDCFGADLMTLDKTLSATGVAGTAIVSGTGSPSVYNGMDGVDPTTKMAISWGSGHLGAPAHGIILADRFHAM
jgi:hypothetical protein